MQPWWANKEQERLDKIAESLGAPKGSSYEDLNKIVEDKSTYSAGPIPESAYLNPTGRDALDAIGSYEEILAPSFGLPTKQHSKLSALQSLAAAEHSVTGQHKDKNTGKMVDYVPRTYPLVEQEGGGPARGMFQIEHETLVDDLRFAASNPEVKKKLDSQISAFEEIGDSRAAEGLKRVREKINSYPTIYSKQAITPEEKELFKYFVGGEFNPAVETYLKLLNIYRRTDYIEPYKRLQTTNPESEAEAYKISKPKKEYADDRIDRYKKFFGYK